MGVAEMMCLGSDKEISEQNRRGILEIGVVYDSTASAIVYTYNTVRQLQLCTDKPTFSVKHNRTCRQARKFTKSSVLTGGCDERMPPFTKGLVTAALIEIPPGFTLSDTILILSLLLPHFKFKIDYDCRLKSDENEAFLAKK